MAWLYQPLLPAAAELESVPPASPISPAYWVGGTGNWTATDPTNWAATSGGAGGAGYPDSTSTVIFDANSSTGSTSFTVTVNGGTCNDLTISNLDGAMTLAPSTGGLTIYGNTSLTSTNLTVSGAASITFASTASKNITSNGAQLDCPVTFNGVAGSWALQDNLTVGSTRTVTLTNGTLNLNNRILTTGLFSSSNSNARTIAFGSGSITLSSATTSTIWNIATTTNLTITGTPLVTTTGAGATTKTISTATLPEATAISFELNNTAGTVAFTAGNTIQNLSVSNNAITVSGSTLSIYGNLVLGGTSPTLSFSTITFLASSGTKVIDLKGDSIGASVNFNGAATWRLLANITFFTTTLTTGTLDLNGFTVAVTQFLSSNSNVRGLLGPGTINVSYAPNDGGFMWTTSNSLNFSSSGDIVVNTSLAFSDSDGTIATGTLSESNAISFVITASSSVFGITRISNGSCFDNLSIINNGQADPSLSAGNNITVYGNLSFTGPSFSSQLLCNITLASTSGTKTITSSGLTVRTPLIFNGVGGTWQLVDNLTMISTAVTTLTNGTVDLNGKAFNVGTRLTTATGTKNITFNGGTLLCPAANTTSFNNAAPTNFTTTAGIGTGKISMSAVTAKTFVGGGSTYNCTLENAGAGALTISGSNTIDDITNSVQPTTFTFTAGTTTTVNNFSVSGTIGNIVTINSTGAAFTLSKSSGIVGVSSCTISNSTATGGATWRAFTGQNNVNGGNNTGWIFTGDVNIIFGNLVMSGGLTITYS